MQNLNAYFNKTFLLYNVTYNQYQDCYLNLNQL